MCPSLLVELGRADQALADAARLAGSLEASGQTTDLVELRAVELWVGAARGNLAPRAAVDWILSAAREVQHVDITPLASAIAAPALAPHMPDEARAALNELACADGAEHSPHFARQLSAVVRAALAIRDRERAERLITKLEPRYPLDEHALASARAQLVEHAGDSPRRQAFTPRPPRVGTSSGTCPSAPTPFSARVAALLRSGSLRRRRRSARRASSSRRWATSRRSRRPRRCWGRARPPRCRDD
jgi:hypothetical protein